MLPTHSRRAFPGIDLLRALAALLVLAYHVVEHGRWTSVPQEGLGYVVRHGWIGVDLFLTISGFVITLSALDGVARDGTAFRQAFALRRLARIVPLYLLTCAVYVLLVVPGFLLQPPVILAIQLGTHLLFVHNLLAATHGSINGPTWSVALEMQFYVLVALAAPWIARMRPGRLLLGTVGVALAWRFGTTLLMVPGSAEPILQFVALTQLPGVLDEFGFGIAAALVVHRGEGRLAAWMQPRWPHCLAWLALAVACGTAAVAWETQGYYWSDRLQLVGWRVLLAAGSASLLLAVVTLPVAGHAVLAPLRWLGDISYGIYLWHMLVLIALANAIPGIGGVQLAVYAAAGTLVLAAMSWHLLEKPNLLRFRGGLRPDVAP